MLSEQGYLKTGENKKEEGHIGHDSPILLELLEQVNPVN
jgi:hypothetical protein